MIDTENHVIFSPMKRRVAREHIDQWVGQNRPDGISKLAVKSQVSASHIQSIRRGLVPSKEVTRQLLCRAIGVSENDLFPPVAAGEEEAG